VEWRFALGFATISQAVPSAQLRRQYLRREASVWSVVKSCRTCLSCLCRPPEHVLPCDHAICDTCICIFGARSQGAEYHFALASCPLCQRPLSVITRLLPPTKRPVLLVLDGGGVRGVITLGFLKALEKQIGGPQGLREAFDLTLGTSAGKWHSVLMPRKWLKSRSSCLSYRCRDCCRSHTPWYMCG
jgi:hypothetical protein